MRATWPRLAAAALGFLWFLQLGGGPTLNPANVDWLLSGDWLQHWLGWLFFRNEAWSLPLGTITSIPYPIGTTVGFTDSNPIVSMLLKPLAGGFPDEVQFIGPWLALCFALQGYAGAALASTVTRHPGHQILAACLFVLSPVLVQRIGHDTLCAQWLLLFLLYFGFREYSTAAEARRPIALAGALVVLASGIHPYLAVMCWVLAMAFYVRLGRSGLATPTRVVIAGLTTTAGMTVVFALFGYFSGASIRGVGFGLFSADLLTLVNPTHFSGLLPYWPMQAAQWEGFGFIGLGGLAAIGVAGLAAMRVRPSLTAGTGVIVAVCVLMGFYALSEDVRLAGQPLLDLGFIYDQLRTPIGPFRASGRFIWPLHYLALLFGAWGLTRVLGANRPMVVTALMAFAVTLQFAEIQPNQAMFKSKTFRQAPIGEFALAVGRYKHIALAPMQVIYACTEPFEEPRIYRYMLHAYRLKMTYNSGIFARVDADKVAAECDRLERVIDAGALDPQTIYVVSPDYLPRFKTAGAVCAKFDGDPICVARDSDERFRTYLETGR